MPEPKEATQGPAAGFTLALSFEPLVNGFWIPIEVDGHVYEPGRCEHWEFGERDGVPTISGFDGCNWFQTSHRGSEQALSLDNGRLTNVGWYITLVGCPNVGVSPLPEEGMQFWIDESGDRLIVTTDSTEAQLQFDRQEETPRCTR